MHRICLRSAGDDSNVFSLFRHVVQRTEYNFFYTSSPRSITFTKVGRLLEGRQVNIGICSKCEHGVIAGASLDQVYGVNMILSSLFVRFVNITIVKSVL